MFDGKRFILFVCTGNTCRSPMGEAWLRWHLTNTNQIHGFEIQSCGVYAMEGMSASDGSVTCLANQNIDLSGHRSKPADASLVVAADVIFCMSLSHQRALFDNYSVGEEKVIVLNVSDPIGFGLQVYQDCFDQIVAGVQANMNKVIEG